MPREIKIAKEQKNCINSNEGWENGLAIAKPENIKAETGNRNLFDK